MDRRTFALTSLAACSVSAIGTSSTGSRRGCGASGPANQEIRLGQAMKLQLESSPVSWQSGHIHLLSFNQITFKLDSESSQLTASMKGKLLTFDDVDYSVGLAVFDEEGLMLGSTSTTCHVPRIWVGRYGQQPVDLTLDFGISNNFKSARRFQASISERTVLTPDQWQKG